MSSLTPRSRTTYPRIARAEVPDRPLPLAAPHASTLALAPHTPSQPHAMSDCDTDAPGPNVRQPALRAGEPERDG